MKKKRKHTNLADNKMIDIEQFRELLHWQIAFYAAIRVIPCLRFYIVL